jgi:hypothetical protein
MTSLMRTSLVKEDNFINENILTRIDDLINDASLAKVLKNVNEDIINVKGDLLNLYNQFYKEKIHNRDVMIHEDGNLAKSSHHKLEGWHN